MNLNYVSNNKLLLITCILDNLLYNRCIRVLIVVIIDIV